MFACYFLTSFMSLEFSSCLFFLSSFKSLFSFAAAESRSYSSFWRCFSFSAFSSFFLLASSISESFSFLSSLFERWEESLRERHYICQQFTIFIHLFLRWRIQSARCDLFAKKNWEIPDKKWRIHKFQGQLNQRSHALHIKGVSEASNWMSVFVSRTDRPEDTSQQTGWSFLEPLNRKTVQICQRDQFDQIYGKR